MLTHPLESLDPAQSVQALPRHLAGPGSVDPRTVWAFPIEEGWTFAQTEAGTATAFSPCLRLQTTFDPQPDKPGKGTWTVNAHRAPFTPPFWRITFDATTPAEILHDVHSELLDLYLQDGDSAQKRLFQDGTPPYEAYALLLTRGWSHGVKTDGTQTFLTPEGLGGVRHRYATGASSEPSWRAWGGYPSEPHWTARFSFGTPTTLVAAFTASLISTEPLRRTVQDVPTQTRRALYVATATGRQPHSNPSVAPLPPAPASGHTR
ncbi:DUF317 domain-containing protein [Streptomyces anthocyanicus]|uniref:DUF317 domain-containing protein n=1 Tax=Streptomyces lividans 1326 TaxID=1200984 RepID=A0A7U9DKK7_STRLI|nr:MULTISPECIES: DUF317 domain-containing protein [Streptomyces]EOY45676.1 hypothetical protein SLI_0959 [Streptomyces lividans 1326]KKD11342.1 hypothetical protein TR66_31370 [Streptomyces sp. WM6391]